MKFIPVVSSMIVAVKYEVFTGRLVVQFDTETFYEYGHVPPEKVAEFMFADSLGSVFTKLIKRGDFPTRRITAQHAHA
jgi:hypothetical protein